MGHTSDPFLKERTAERTLAAMQRMAAEPVTKLKPLHATKKGSGLRLVLVLVVVMVVELDGAVAAFSCSTSPFLAILVFSSFLGRRK